jgi:D-ribose pyranose/furanose isomerase RbsD
MDKKLTHDIPAFAGVLRAVVNELVVESLAELVGAESIGNRKLVEKISESRDREFHD